MPERAKAPAPCDPQKKKEIHFAKDRRKAGADAHPRPLHEDCSLVLNKGGAQAEPEKIEEAFDRGSRRVLEPRQSMQVNYLRHRAQKNFEVQSLVLVHVLDIRREHVVVLI